MSFKDNLDRMRSALFNTDLFAEIATFQRMNKRSFPVSVDINELDTESYSSNEAKTAEIEIMVKLGEVAPEKSESIITKLGVRWAIEELLSTDEISWKVLCVKELRPRL